MRKPVFSFLIAILLTGLITSVHAEGVGIHNADLFDSILNRFATTTSQWGKQMQSYASWLFWSLTLISMVWTYGFMALRKADLQELFAETIRFFVVTGFFYWLLENGPAIAMSIIDSLRQIASKASGLNKLVSPSGIVDIGFDIASKVVDASSIWSPATTTVGLLIAAIILVVLALVGVNMLIILISAWILAYGGVFLLGFGGGRWTQDIAINYYRTVLSIALQSFAMILIIGIGKSFIDQYYAAMSGDMAIKELFVMLVVAIILLALINKIPPLLAGIVNGGGFNGGGTMGLGGAMGAAGLAAATLSGGMSAAMGAAASSAGGAQALKVAFQAAQQSLSEGNAHSQKGSSSPSGGLASAIGHASRFAQTMGSHLAQGTADTFKDKLDSMKESISSRVSETTGGQIADAINQRSNESQTESMASQGNSDSSLSSLLKGSLAKGESPSLHEEVSQFVNKATGTEG
ncbi:P-type conjugative transfer protein TrbL [Legionella sp.]|uniref:P-type conjugative transfer protein TrbL n=1 Tax=Legionella sp. TaxID=459 RepID=UPI000CC8E2A0|nr:P-type conjugative transfer protein TrbL [Legionella sp.]PJE09586.1 MAG: P-type conjugative transfer protein TrbL [Legionella sp.]